MLKLIRSEENPILIPSNLPWENMLIFNPGAIMVNESTYLLYRALGKNDNRSHLGFATSIDGIHFERKPEPLYSGGENADDSLGIEDCRVVGIDGTYYLTYTAASGTLDDIIPKIALLTTKDFVSFTNYGVIIPQIKGKNASFFPKKIQGEYWLLYREAWGKTYFAKSPTITSWPERRMVFEKRPGYWDSKRTGIGAPPIETEKGWLLFYHGVDEKEIYRLGVLFLDYDNPTKILYRSPEPILEPEKTYEKFGYNSNVVFTCGAVEKNDQYYVYYGAADQVIGLATVEKKSLLSLF